MADRRHVQRLGRHAEPVAASAGLTRQRDLTRTKPVQCRQRRQPDEPIRLESKRLGRFDSPGPHVTVHRIGQSRDCGIGWALLQLCIGGGSRVAFSQILPDEPKERAAAFLKAAAACYLHLGVAVARVMSDIGSGYRSVGRRTACAALGPRPAA
jgi:hypothetical protein